MNENVRIARELAKIAKSICASDAGPYETKWQNYCRSSEDEDDTEFENIGFDEVKQEIPSMVCYKENFYGKDEVKSWFQELDRLVMWVSDFKKDIAKFFEEIDASNIVRFDENNNGTGYCTKTDVYFYICGDEGVYKIACDKYDQELSANGGDVPEALRAAYYYAYDVFDTEIKRIRNNCYM